MPVVYPMLGAACLSVAFILFFTYWVWDRTPVILPIGVHFLIESLTLLLLTLTTGHNPMLDIAMFRTWIVWLRFLMLINTIFILYWQVKRFSERKK